MRRGIKRCHYQFSLLKSMRIFLPFILASILMLYACGDSSSNQGLPRLVIEPDDGRSPILDVIAGATNNIRLTIYQITDLQSVSQNPPAPADSIAAALINKAQSGVDVKVIVDHNQYSGTGSTSLEIQKTVEALRSAGATVHLSSTAFCVTHQKTFIIDGPTSENPGLYGTAIIMSLNMMPDYFGGSRDYAVITSDPGIVNEASRVFDSDFMLVSPGECIYAYTPGTTNPPPYSYDTPSLSQTDLLWSPVNSKSKLLQLIGSTKKSLVLTTEVMNDTDMVNQIKAVAQSADRPTVQILLSGDTGSNASAVKTLLDLGLPNLSIRVMPGQPSSPSDYTPSTPLYMHGKQVIVDGVKAFVGSENLTNTSLIQNRELGIFFTNPGMIARLQSIFTNDFTTPGNSYPAQAY
jgi:cardiolipin synthase A/B